MRIVMLAALAVLGGCSGKPADPVEDNAVVAVPQLKSYEFTAGSWMTQPAPGGGAAAAYVDVETIPLFIVECDRAGQRLLFKLSGDLPDGVHMMHVETDGAVDNLAAAAEPGDIAMVSASAPIDSAFVTALGKKPERIGARIGNAPGFLAPGDNAVVKVVEACR